MSDIRVITVQSRRDKRRFLNLPWKLYQDDPLWIPPLRLDQRELLNFRAHPFYERNEIQTFLVERDGKAVGRIAAILNRGHIERYDQQLGFWGFFDCVDDQEVADALFQAAKGWLAEQHDIHWMRGPCNPSLNHTVGLLVEGFDTSPFFMMTYNHAYYEGLVENAGFKKVQDLYAYWGHIDMLPEVQERLLPICEKITKYTGAVVRPLDKKHFRDDVAKFLSIYNQSLSNTWGFVPMSDAELKIMAKGLRMLMVPELALAVDIEGQMAGAVFGLPDYNPRIRKIDGRLFPFGWIRLLRRKHRIKNIRIISANVLPEFSMQGLGLVLMNGLVPKTIEWGIQQAEFSWVLESNQFSRGSLERGGAKLEKTYRIYDWREADE
jgi:hypothetical protein